MLNVIGTNVAGPKDEETQVILDRHLLNHIHLLKEEKTLALILLVLMSAKDGNLKQLLSIL
jgi:hypothetical protein